MDKLDYHVTEKEAQETHGNRLADAAFRLCKRASLTIERFNCSTFFMWYLVFDEYK